MGTAKRMLEEQESRRSVAMSIAVDAGFVSACENHEDEFIDQLCFDEGVARREVRLWAKNAGQALTAAEVEKMVEEVKDAAGESGDECGSCAKWRDDD